MYLTGDEPLPAGICRPAPGSISSAQVLQSRLETEQEENEKLYQSWLFREDNRAYSQNYRDQNLVHVARLRRLFWRASAKSLQEADTLLQPKHTQGGDKPAIHGPADTAG